MRWGVGMLLGDFETFQDIWKLAASPMYFEKNGALICPGPVLCVLSPQV